MKQKWNYYEKQSLENALNSNIRCFVGYLYWKHIARHLDPKTFHVIGLFLQLILTTLLYEFYTYQIFYHNFDTVCG